MIECRTLHGSKRFIQADQLVLRASAYGLLIHDGALLLLRGRHTGKYALPGGGVNPGERLEDALRREVREEAGLEIRIERFLPSRKISSTIQGPFHGLLFFTKCHCRRRLSRTRKWMMTTWNSHVGFLGDLTAASFQSHGENDA
jgi:8-oxo-dGTP pyrophosphatase MutT (NUDIX family)